MPSVRNEHVSVHPVSRTHRLRPFSSHSWSRAMHTWSSVSPLDSLPGCLRDPTRHSYIHRSRLRNTPHKEQEIDLTASTCHCCRRRNQKATTMREDHADEGWSAETWRCLTKIRQSKMKTICSLELPIPRRHDCQSECDQKMNTESLQCLIAQVVNRSPVVHGGFFDGFGHGCGENGLSSPLA